MRGYNHLDLLAGILLLAGLATMFFSPAGWGLILAGAGVFGRSLRRDFLARLGKRRGPGVTR